MKKWGLAAPGPSPAQPGESWLPQPRGIWPQTPESVTWRAGEGAGEAPRGRGSARGRIYGSNGRPRVPLKSKSEKAPEAPTQSGTSSQNPPESRWWTGRGGGALPGGSRRPPPSSPRRLQARIRVGSAKSEAILGWTQVVKLVWGEVGRGGNTGSQKGQAGMPRARKGEQRRPKGGVGEGRRRRGSGASEARVKGKGANRGPAWKRHLLGLSGSSLLAQSRQGPGPIGAPARGSGDLCPENQLKGRPLVGVTGF